MADYSSACSQVIDAVGGLDNIVSVAHCATRLRLVLVDKKKYDSNTIDKIEGVQGLFFNSGQLQIIFGLNVPEVYKTFLKVSSEQGKDFSSVKMDVKPKKQNFIMAMLKTLPPIIMPILGVMVSCALITAILSIINIILVKGFDVDITGNNWYLLFNNIGSLVTNFLILFICLSAAKLWKVNIFIAGAIGVFLVGAPSIGVLIPGWSEYWRTDVVGTTGESINIEIGKINGTAPYVTSIFTGIAAIKFCSIIEHWLNKKVSDNWKMFFVASISIVLTLIFSLLFFGPIMKYLEEGLRIVSAGVTDKSLYGFGVAILACFMAPIIITGIHQIFTPIILGNIAATAISNNGTGFDLVVATMIASNIAQSAAAFSVGFKTKDHKIKSLALSSGVVALMGITEPAMFGVNLRNKKAFISAMLGAFCGGWFLGFMQVAQIGMGPSPGLLTLLFSLPTKEIEGVMQGPTSIYNIAWMAIGMAISFGVTMLISLLWMSTKTKEKQSVLGQKLNLVKTQIGVIHTNFMNSKFMIGYENFKRNITFLYDKKAKTEFEYPNLPQLNQVDSPIEGKYIKLSDVKDPIFSSGTMGIGFAIDPTNGIVRSPFHGEVTMVFATKHALSLKSNDGIEVLIHIGIDTVKLGGKYFKTYVSENQLVKQGDKLIKFNYKKIKKLGYENCVISIITNKQENKKYDFILENNNQTDVKYNQEIIAIN